MSERGKGFETLVYYQSGCCAKYQGREGLGASVAGSVHRYFGQPVFVRDNTFRPSSTALQYPSSPVLAGSVN